MILYYLAIFEPRKPHKQGLYNLLNGDIYTP